MRKVSGETAVYGVLGWPVEHSLSPALHNAWFAAAGIDAVYVALPTRPARGDALLAAVRTLGLAGVNATAPHKVALHDAVDGLLFAARATGAVNTLVRQQDGAWWGDNTDAEGFVAAHAAWFAGRWEATDVTVIGAGGAAAAVAVGTLMAGARTVRVAARRPEAAEALAARLAAVGDVAPIDLNARAVAQAALVVIATGRGGETVGTGWSAALRPGAVVADLNYWHAGPGLRAEAEVLGHPVTDGSGMLLHQAAAAFSRWTGRAPDLASGRAILDAHLAARFGYRRQEG